MADTPPADPPADPPEAPPGPASPPVAPPGPPADPNTPPDPLEPQDGDNDAVAALRREAASWRTRLRDAEQERDRLRGRVERMERADVQRLAADAGFAQADDIFMFATDLERLRGDGGELDAARVTDLAQRVLTERPGLRKPGPEPAGGSRLANGSPQPHGLYDLLEQSRRR